MQIRASIFSYSIPIIFVALFLSFPSAAVSSQHSTYSARAFFGTQYSSTERRTTFEPHETIYLYIEFDEPIRKVSNLSVNWFTPAGNHERSHTQTIQPTNRKDVVYFSWLKLIKEGTFTRTFTGDDYDPSFYGLWQILVSLDGYDLCKLEFEMIVM